MSKDTIPPPLPTFQPTEDERTWGMLAHLSCFIASLAGLPFLGPLVVWMMKKDQSQFVADQAREALNFQLAMLVAILVCTATCIGIILVPVIAIAGIIYPILGGLEANKGIVYRYPYTIRFISGN
jgi:uncharacterized Tic20 family protein